MDDNYYKLGSSQPVQNQTSAASPEPTKSKTWVLVLAAILVLAGLIYAWQSYQKQQFIKKQTALLSSVKAALPANLFVGGDESKAVLYQVPKSDEFKLRSNEALPEYGATYTVNKEQKIAQQDFFNEVKSKNWLFISGTNLIDGGVVLKFSDGQKNYFARFTGGLQKGADGNYTTTVNLVTINKN